MKASISNEPLFNKLLDSHFTRSARITLPLAGDVNLWVVYHDPFPPDLLPAYEPLTLLEQAVRGAERLMGLPFPTTDVILLVHDPAYNIYLTHAAHLGEYMRVQRGISEFFTWDSPIYHEVAHYYFTGHSRIRWVTEGGAELVEWYVRIAEGQETLESSLDHAAFFVQHSCVPSGFEKIHALTPPPDYTGPAFSCNYTLGRYLFVSLLDLLGEAALSSALRELYLTYMDRSTVDPNGPGATEEEIYRLFLKHTPPGLEEDFRDLYRRIHGGPFIDG